MPTPLREVLDRAVAAGILSPDQAAAVAALDTQPTARSSTSRSGVGMVVLPKCEKRRRSR